MEDAGSVALPELRYERSNHRLVRHLHHRSSMPQVSHVDFLVEVGRIGTESQYQLRLVDQDNAHDTLLARVDSESSQTADPILASDAPPMILLLHLVITATDHDHVLIRLSDNSQTDRTVEVVSHLYQSCRLSEERYMLPIARLQSICGVILEAR